MFSFKEFVFPFSLPPSTTWKLFPTTAEHADDNLCTVLDSDPPAVPMVTSLPSSPSVKRRTQRTRTAPLWMKDYVTVVQQVPSICILHWSVSLL